MRDDRERKGRTAQHAEYRVPVDWWTGMLYWVFRASGYKMKYVTEIEGD